MQRILSAAIVLLATLAGATLVLLITAALINGAAIPIP